MTAQKPAFGCGVARETKRRERKYADAGPPDPALNPKETYLQLGQKRIVSAAINKLTPTVRAALELRELAEVSTRETTRLMGISVAAVKARLFHGRRKLRDRLKHYVGSAWMWELTSGLSD